MAIVRALATLLCVTMLPALTLADVVHLEPDRDTTIFEEAPGTLANGAGSYLFIGTNAGSFSRRLLIHFDVAGNVPAGSVITDAQLVMNMSRTISGRQQTTLHPVLAAWGEGTSDAPGEEGMGAPASLNDATWLHTYHDTQFWATAGGDLDFNPLAFVAITGIGTYTFGPNQFITAQVQAWVEVPETNFGWMVLGNEFDTAAAKRFDSREHPDLSRRPVLVINFDPPLCNPEPRGPGYWNRQCLGLGEEAGGSSPRGHGGGPRRTTEPDFENVLACTDAALADTAPGDTACIEIGPLRRRDPCRRARRRLTSLLFNVCAERLQTSCPVQAPPACAASTVGDVIDKVEELLAAGQCRRAARCGRVGLPETPDDESR